MKFANLRLRRAAVAIVVVATWGCAPGAVPPTVPAATQAVGASGSPAGSSGICATPTKVQLGYESVEQSDWPMWIAKEQGYFDKYGINAELIFAEGSKVLSGVLSKVTPVAYASGSDILPPVAEGGDIIAVLSQGSTPTDMIVGGKGITKPEDLKGKVVGSNILGGEADTLIRLGLKRMGLTPDTDTRVIAVGGETTRIAALTSGQIQATLVNVGLRQEMADAGFATLFDFTTSDFKLLKGALITTRSYADANPQTVQCIVNALVDAIAFYKKNKAESVAAFAKYSGNADTKSIQTAWDIWSPLIPERPVVDKEAMANIQNLDPDPKIKAVDLTKVIDNSFIENVTLK